jgi:ubiquinone/menaquinone biosynthesis C-methylase UbiE
MSTEPRRELSSTYFVPDRSSDDERNRVRMQDIMTTSQMGGVLPEQTAPSHFRRVIDVGCGTGGWLIELAKAYPTIELLVGADISIHMIEYARQQAKTEGVDDRVEFQVMDALRMIEFPQHYFDLLNQRFGWSYLRTWDWPNLLTKYQYATRSGGVVRITESDLFGPTNSPALTQLIDLARNASSKAGHMFGPIHTEFASALPDLLERHGFQNVQSRPILLHYEMGNPEMEKMREDLRLTFRTVIPFLRKWTKLPEDYETIYQQAVREMEDPGFTIDWDIVTVWGQTP